MDLLNRPLRWSRSARSTAQVSRPLDECRPSTMRLRGGENTAGVRERGTRWLLWPESAQAGIYRGGRGSGIGETALPSIGGRSEGPVRGKRKSGQGIISARQRGGRGRP